MISQDHILNNIPYLPSPNVGDLFSPGLPDIIILHYTACSDADRAICMLMDPQREVSAHLVVDRSGSTTQLVPFNQIAWHAGKSTWKGRESLNKYSVGIEIVNAGPLTLENGIFYTWDKLVVPNSEVHPRINENSECEYWHKYTSEQIFTVKKNLYVAYKRILHKRNLSTQ